MRPARAMFDPNGTRITQDVCPKALAEHTIEYHHALL
jgi:hypothetical protein